MFINGEALDNEVAKIGTINATLTNTTKTNAATYIKHILSNPILIVTLATLDIAMLLYCAVRSEN